MSEISSKEKIKKSELWGGKIGTKKSNNNNQYYLQARIYKGDIAICVCTCCNPYYVIYERKKFKE